MYAVPDVEEVVSVARSLGIHLRPDEATLYRKYLIDHLDALDELVQSRIEEPSPPMAWPHRQLRHKPTAGMPASVQLIGTCQREKVLA